MAVHAKRTKQRKDLLSLMNLVDSLLVPCAFHGGNFDDLASIPAMIGTVVVSFCVLFS